MNQNTRTIVGVLFLLLSVLLISFFRINPASTTPTRSTQARNAGIMGTLVQGMIVTQEVTALKDYISGVDLIFTHGGSNNTNENTLLLLDAGYNMLYKKNFSSAMVKEGDLTTLLFDRPIYTGKGNHVYLCLYTNDGIQGNAVSPLINLTDSIGALYVSKVVENDLIGSVKDKFKIFRGSLMMRTYETDSSQFWLMKIFLYIIAGMISCLIIWFTLIVSFLSKTRIVPEWIFLAIALPVATIFTFITPPLQVPDEGSHFQRSYEIAEFRMFDQHKTGPVSILMLDSAFMNLHFSAGEKTSMADIKKYLGVKLEPAKRAPTTPPAYTVPYLPQAFGIFTGKIFGASPLVLMYLGRLFNMIISVLIMFYAIRLIPQFKWIFLLLALMPKTLFLFGSLSYDSLTISLTFFTVAVFFYYTWACERELNLKDLAVMGTLVLLLLLCKPPYFSVGLLFFFIPRKKFGKMYRYIMISIGVAVLAIAIFVAGPAVMKYKSGNGPSQQQVDAAASDTAVPQALFRPDEQIRNIMNDIPGYLTLITKSGVVKNGGYILDSFVGLLGWIDVELPALLTNAYLLILLLAALALSGSDVKLGFTKKSLLAFLLVFAFIVVHTAMFIYATRPGRDQVFGVQGRYFIPVAPLFFMLFYNRYLGPKLNVLFSSRRKEYNNAKIKVKPVIFKEIVDSEQLFDKALYLFFTCFCTFTLVYSIYITLIRYYNI